MPSANRDKSFWLYLEPWVHVTSGSGKVLFYNTLNKKSLLYNNNRAANKLAKSFIDPENGYVIRVSEAEIAKTATGAIIAELKKLFMGDLLDTSWSEGKPVNILPKPFIKNKLTRNVFDNPDDLSLVNYDDYLHEITMYLGTGSSGVVKDYPLAAKQFLFPGAPSGVKKLMDFDILSRLAVELSVFKLITLNFTGLEQFSPQKVLEAAELFKGFKCDKKFHLAVSKFNASLVNELFEIPSVSFAVYITFPFDPEKFNEMVKTIAASRHPGRFEFHFVVKNKKELESSLEIIETANIANYFFNPCYDGNNFDFFREFVFITQEDVDGSKPDQHQVFSRLAFNENDFGKLTILPGGQVYANLNDPVVGTFPENSVVDLIVKETLDGKSWKRTRKATEPMQKVYKPFPLPASKLI